MTKYALQATTANGIGIIILVSLLLNLRRKYDKKKDEHTIFGWMLAINILQCILEAITIFIDGKSFQGARVLATVTNALLFINNILFAAFWVLYADLRLRKFQVRSRNKYSLIFIPGVLVIIGAIVNLFTPVFFEITAENLYRRTKLFPLTYVAAYFYLLWGLLVAYGVRQKMDKYVFLPAVTFLMPIALASILQLVFQGVSLLWVGAAVGLMAAYMSLQDERAAIDPLAGVFTRHYMNQYLENLCKKSSAMQRISGIMLDIDKFKGINDQHGHLIGDEVIRKFGALLRSAVNSRGLVFRYAGDEFVIVVTNYSKEELSALIDTVYAEIEKVNGEGNDYKISCSLGLATYVPGESARHFLKRMDDAMYTNKNNKKKKEEGTAVVGSEGLIEAGIDVPELLDRLMQNKTLIRVFIKKFLEDQSCARLREATQAKDYKQMEFYSHILKGMCGNLSLKSLYGLFSEQVRLLRAGEGEQAAYMMPQIDEEYGSAIAHMSKWLRESSTTETK